MGQPGQTRLVGRRQVPDNEFEPPPGILGKRVGLGLILVELLPEYIGVAEEKRGVHLEDQDARDLLRLGVLLDVPEACAGRGVGCRGSPAADRAPLT